MPNIFQHTAFLQYLIERGDRLTLTVFLQALYPDASREGIDVLIQLLEVIIGGDTHASSQ